MKCLPMVLYCCKLLFESLQFVQKKFTVAIDFTVNRLFVRLFNTNIRVTHCN